MTTTTLSPDEFAQAIEQHYAESADDARRVIVGVQDEMHTAEIYGRYAHLYTREQLDSLGAARDAAGDAVERDRLDRLWHTAAEALAAADVVQASQDLANDQLAWRTSFEGEERSRNDLGAMLASEDDYDRRERIYAAAREAAEHFTAREVELAERSQRLRSEVYGMDGEIAIAEARMGIDLRAFAADVKAVSDRTADAYAAQVDELMPRLLGRDETRPSRGHAAWLRSLHHRDDTYTRERMSEVCERTVAELGFDMATIPTILPDLEDRPQKDPRACVIPVKVPDEVHLVVRPTGGISDYQAFLHEAGHALHFGLTDASLPIEHRVLSPDHALTEVWSYVVERITHEPAWHQRHFGLSREEAEQACAEIRFIDAALFRRYAAKIRYELEFWSDPSAPGLPERYAELLSEATLQHYPTSEWADDIDPGLYVADYLRAWRTSAQVLSYLRERHGEDWFCSGAAADELREWFARGTLPTNEQVAEAVGGGAHDFDGLAEHLSR